MIIKDFINIVLKPKKKFFVQIGFVFSLIVLLLLLMIMHFFSASNQKIYYAVNVEMPLESGMAKDLRQISLQQQSSAPPAVTTPPTNTNLNIVPDNVVQDKDITNENEVGASTEKQENKISGNGSGDNAETSVEDPTPFELIEDQPVFSGGMEAMLKYLADNIKYPPKAKESGISGTVIISFVVEKDGSVSTVKVVRGIGGGCNEEAVRVVRSMPKWSPGKQRGITVRTQFQIPLIFFLRPK